VRDPRAVDHRTDLWSLGVVAYRLLSARYPFAGDSAKEILAAIVSQRPRRLRDHGVDVPEPVEAIIERCLSPKREDRYADAGALAAAFAPFASERWRRYGELVPAIVRRTPAPAPPPPEAAPPAVLDASALLADPPTRTVAPEVAVTPPATATERGRDGARPSVTLLMDQRPAASPAAHASVSPPVPVATPARGSRRALVAGALLALLAAGVGVGWRSRSKPSPPPLPTLAPADVSAAAPIPGVAAVASSSGSEPASSPALVPSAAPVRSSAGTPVAVPRATRRRPPAATPSPSPSPAAPAPSASQAPKSVLQPNPYVR
jgi:serine/threonine-protein kinase